MYNGLKKCPFCGGEAQINAHGFSQYSVRCVECDAITGRYMGKDNATAAWNRRDDSCTGCKYNGLYENEVEYGYSSPCTLCKRRRFDNYEGENK